MSVTHRVSFEADRLPERSCDVQNPRKMMPLLLTPYLLPLAFVGCSLPVLVVRLINQVADLEDGGAINKAVKGNVSHHVAMLSSWSVLEAAAYCLFTGSKNVVTTACVNRKASTCPWCLWGCHSLLGYSLVHGRLLSKRSPTVSTRN